MNEIMIISIAIAAFLLFHEAMPRTAKSILWFLIFINFAPGFVEALGLGPGFVGALGLAIISAAIWWAVNDDEQEA